MAPKISLLQESRGEIMKVHFWDGSEFKGTAIPCCEIHVLGYRIKLLIIGKNKVTLFYKERILPEGYMTILKNIARQVLRQELTDLKKESDLMYSWVKYHQRHHELALKIRSEVLAEAKAAPELRNALKEIAKSCPLLNQDKNAMYGEEASNLFARSTTRRMEIAKEALK
jgi:hypothetical protein